MKFNAANQPSAIVVAYSALLTALFSVRYYMVPYSIEITPLQGMPFAEGLSRFSLAHPAWSIAVTTLLVLWTILLIMQITVRAVSAAKRNYLAIPLFLVVALGVVVPEAKLAAYGSALLLALSTKQFIGTFRKEYRFDAAFRAGLYAGLIPLLYAPAIIILPFIPLVLLHYRRGMREVIVGVAGYLLPMLATSYIYWAIGEKASFIWMCLVNNIITPSAVYQFSSPFAPLQIALMALVIILVLMAAVSGYSLHKGMRTRQRKILTHTLVMVVSTMVILAMANSNPTGLPMIAFAISLSVPYAFSACLSIAASVTYHLIIALSLVSNIVPFSHLS